MSSGWHSAGLAMRLLADSAEGVGYLLKDRISDVKEFVAAVERVAAGGSAIDPIIVSTLLARRRRDDPLAELTPREREVLELMALGASNTEIAQRFVVSEATVKTHVGRVLAKTGSRDRVQAVVLAYRTGLVQPGDLLRDA